MKCPRADARKLYLVVQGTQGEVRLPGAQPGSTSCRTSGESITQRAFSLSFVICKMSGGKW